MDGDRDRDSHWNTGLNSLGPNEKQKEREREQRRQDQREPLDGWRYRRKSTLEHRTESPKVQMRSRRRKNMKKEIRTARGAITHWYKGTDLMRVHQGQLDWDWTSTWSNQILWMWLAWSLSEKPLTMALGLVSSAYTGFWGSSLFGYSESV